jgi:hypothetical protein
MPDISLTYPTKLNAGSWMDLFHDLDSPSTSLAVLNGLLDENNLASGESIKDEHTQRGSWCFARGSAGNLNLDYFGPQFGDFTGDTNSDEAVAIPGGGVPVFIPWAGARVLVMAQVFWTNSSDNTAEDSVIFLRRNSSTVDANTYRRVNLTIDTGVTP